MSIPASQKWLIIAAFPFPKIVDRPFWTTTMLRNWTVYPMLSAVCFVQQTWCCLPRTFAPCLLGIRAVIRDISRHRKTNLCNRPMNRPSMLMAFVQCSRYVRPGGCASAARKSRRVRRPRRVCCSLDRISMCCRLHRRVPREWKPPLCPQNQRVSPARPRNSAPPHPADTTTTRTWHSRLW